MGFGNRIERAGVLHLPAKRYHIAHSQGRVEFGDRLLHEEVTLAADFQTNPHVVAR